MSINKSRKKFICAVTIYGVSFSSDMSKILAFASLDLIALNAAKLAVPPPISKYGTYDGMSFDVSGLGA